MKIAICATDFVYRARFGAVWIILSFRTREEAVEGYLLFAGDFDLLLSYRTHGQFVPNALHVGESTKP